MSKRLRLRRAKALKAEAERVRRAETRKWEERMMRIRMGVYDDLKAQFLAMDVDPGAVMLVDEPKQSSRWWPW